MQGKLDKIQWVYFQLRRFKAFLRGNRGGLILLTHCYIFDVIFMLYKLLHYFVSFTFKR